VDKKNQQSKNQYGTLTAKHDANNDYGGKSGNKNTNTQAGGKKVLTSDKNIGD
jgi:hypothetical protein